MEGYALVETDSVDDNFGSDSTLRSHIDGYADTQTTLPVMRSYDNRLALPFDNTRGSKMVVSLINGTSRDSALSFTVRDEFGNVIGSGSAVLNSYLGTSKLLTDLFPYTAGLRGNVEVRATGLGVGMYAVQFTDLSVSYIPAFTNAAWL